MSHLRQEFDKWCFKLFIADSVNAKNMESFKDKYTADPIWKSTQQLIAREKGYFFLKNNEYASAERFFKVSNDERLVKYCKASENARVASDLLSLEIDEDIVKRYGNMDTMQKEACKMFLESASLFVELNKPNEAGKCYFAAERYDDALDCFRQGDNKLNLGHTHFMLRQYEAALPLYYELE